MAEHKDNRSIRKDHHVRLARDIYRSVGEDRKHRLYASEGETGVVVEVFEPQSTSCGESAGSDLYAKVRMDSNGTIKTFRLTSVKRTDTSDKTKRPKHTYSKHQRRG